MRVPYLICHGRPDRCLTVVGYQFPICARCTAIYTGIAFGLGLEMLFGPPSRQLLPVILLFAVPCGIDGVTQLVLKRESTNLIRLFTGFPAGVAVIICLRMLHQMVM